VYPLSFSEFIRFSKHQADVASTKGIATVRRLFDAFLHWGSYPAVTGIEEHSIETLLRDYFDTMILKTVRVARR
jgi:predicted AAA+ superfamily ATPase